MQAGRGEDRPAGNAQHYSMNFQCKDAETGIDFNKIFIKDFTEEHP